MTKTQLAAPLTHSPRPGAARRRLALATALLQLALVTPAALASFAGTDVFLPSVGRGEGAGGAQWYTTVWVYNPGGRAADVQLSFYLRDQANSEPDGVYNERIAAGDTVRFVNAVETLFGVPGFGALRVASDQPLVVNSRIFTVPAGDTEADSLGQFFAAVPASFALGEGDSTSLLGVYRTDPQNASDYRYNFGLMEVTGGAATVKVTVLGEDGASLGDKQYQLGAYQPLQKAVSDVVSGLDTTNARIEVEVLSGPGRVIAFGSGLANRGNDPSTFEMQFADALLATGSGGGELSLPYSGSGSTAGDLFALVNTGAGQALHVTSATGRPLRADTTSGWAAVSGHSASTTGVFAQSNTGVGVDARSTSGLAVSATSGSTTAVIKAVATGAGAAALRGDTSQPNGFGVAGYGASGGIYGAASGNQGTAIQGVANGGNGIGVHGLADSGTQAAGVYGESSTGYAAYFAGKVQVNGSFNVTGTKNFRIDHPLDPEGAFLVHAAVESAEVLNLYSGTVTLDGSGRAVVELPPWFEAVNRDLRYQLTCVGAFAPVYVAEKVRDHRFVIAGGAPGLEVSWQVTGVRADRWLELNPFAAEVGKEDAEAGRYLCPECYGQPEARSLVPPPERPIAE